MEDQGPEKVPDGRRITGRYVTHRFGAVPSSSWSVVNLWMVPSNSGGRAENQVVTACRIGFAGLGFGGLGGVVIIMRDY